MPALAGLLLPFHLEDRLTRADAQRVAHEVQQDECIERGRRHTIHRIVGHVFLARQPSQPNSKPGLEKRFRGGPAALVPAIRNSTAPANNTTPRTLAIDHDPCSAGTEVHADTAPRRSPLGTALLRPVVLLAATLASGWNVLAAENRFDTRG